MKHMIKKYWYLLLIVLVIPILLNYTLPLSFSFTGDIVGGENSAEVWLGFFGSYIGSIIGAIVTFIVLYFTIESNKQENNKIRLNSEFEKKQLLCVEYIYSYSIDEIYNILYRWYNHTEILKELSYDLRIIRNLHNKSWYNFQIVFDVNDKFYSQQKKNHDLFTELLNKVEFMLNLRSYFVKYPNKEDNDYAKLINRYPECNTQNKDEFLEKVLEQYYTISPNIIYEQSKEYLTSLQNKILDNGKIKNAESRQGGR